MVEVRFESGSEMEEQASRPDKMYLSPFVLSLFPLYGGFGETGPRYGGTYRSGTGHGYT